MPHTLEVSTPTNDDRILVDKVYRNRKIEREGNLLPIDLVLLPLRGYEVILGVDWLFKYGALVDGRNKKIKVSGMGKPEVEISLNKKNLTCLVSGIKARKCIWKGATGWLAYLMNDPLEPLKVENIPVITEYLEVFPRS